MCCEIVGQLNSNGDTSSITLAADLKAVRFESKLHVTSSNILYSMGVSPLVRPRDKVDNVNCWTEQRICDEFELYEKLWSDTSNNKELRVSVFN